jgi:hypothetical protein
VDIGGLVRRLLLFDGYILDSYGLQEFPQLIDTFGVSGVITLLESGVFGLRIDATTIAQVGQANVTDKRLRLGQLPLGSFQIAALRGSNRREHTSLRLEVVDSYLGKSKTAQKLKRAIVDRLVYEPDSVWQDTLESVHAGLAGEPPALRQAIAAELTRISPKTVGADEVQLTVHRLDEEDFRVESNLQSRFALSEEESHKTVERAVLAVAAVKKRIAEMKGYEALTGFRPEELPLLDVDVRTTLELLGDSGARERDLERVIEIAALPDVRDAAGATREIDIEALLSLRETGRGSQVSGLAGVDEWHGRRRDCRGSSDTRGSSRADTRFTNCEGCAFRRDYRTGSTG